MQDWRRNWDNQTAEIEIKIIIIIIIIINHKTS